MARFKRLTDAEARTLTRAELLDRVEGESAYWDRQRPRTEADWDAHREFGRIMHAYLSPSDAIQAAMDTLAVGERSNYWQSQATPREEPEAAQ
jgi:hypothetical protein